MSKRALYLSCAVGVVLAASSLCAQVMPDSEYTAGYNHGRLFARSQVRYKIAPCVITSLTSCVPGIPAVGAWTATNKEDRGGAAAATYYTAPIVPLLLGVARLAPRQPPKLPAGHSASYFEGYKEGYDDAWAENVNRSCLYSSASAFILVGITIVTVLLAK